MVMKTMIWAFTSLQGRGLNQAEPARRVSTRLALAPRRPLRRRKAARPMGFDGPFRIASTLYERIKNLSYNCSMMK